jgi:serine/threonine protein kinase
MTFTPAGWTKLDEMVGAGGQGAVTKVRKEPTINVRESVVQLSRTVVADNNKVEIDNFIRLINEVTSLPIGALKVLNHESPKAVERMRREIAALNKHRDPSVVEVYDHGEHEGRPWVITKYCSGGPMSRCITTKWKGDALGAIRALLPVVAALEKIHAEGTLHRDIKTDNVFMDGSELKLGDFGLAFDLADDGTRVSTTMESAGTVDWMAPWAHGQRIEECTSALDVFGLAKVLYCMISGREKLVHWDHRHATKNLEIMFPERPEMKLINRVLDGIMVQYETDCKIKNCAEFVVRLQDIINSAGPARGLPIIGGTTTCRMCGLAPYKSIGGAEGNAPTPLHFVHNMGFNPRGENKMKIFKCHRCGHLVLFELSQLHKSIWDAKE